MPLTLVVQSAKSFESIYSNDGKYLISYKLPEPLHFDEPHFACLNRVTGAERPVLVFTDFTERQIVNGDLAPFLGCSGDGSRTWIPIASNHIPSYGYLRLHTASDQKLGPNKSFTIIINIASKSELENGAQVRSYF